MWSDHTRMMITHEMVYVQDGRQRTLEQDYKREAKKDKMRNSQCELDLIYDVGGLKIEIGWLNIGRIYTIYDHAEDAERTDKSTKIDWHRKDQRDDQMIIHLLCVLVNVCVCNCYDERFGRKGNKQKQKKMRRKNFKKRDFGNLIWVNVRQAHWLTPWTTIKYCPADLKWLGWRVKDGDHEMWKRTKWNTKRKVTKTMIRWLWQIEKKEKNCE